MTQVLHSYLCEEILNREPGAVGLSDDLLASGLVDSMGMMRFIRFIEERFTLKVPPEDLVLENFSSLDAITTYLSGRGATSG